MNAMNDAEKYKVMAEYLAGRCADLDYLLARETDAEYSKAEDYMRYAENYWNFVSKKEKNNG